MKKIITILIGLFVAATTLTGQDFSMKLKNGGNLYFRVIDTLKHEVRLVRMNSWGDLRVAQPKGHLDIPASVVYQKTTYQVTSIGDAVFADAKELTSVSIPSTVTMIGDRVFQGCTSLTGVVFPAQEPILGVNVFDGCTALADISLGSDWQSVDFKKFPENNEITQLYIPARIRKISNLKRLKSLVTITVDTNNPSFSSTDGLLYSKNGKVLYACPNAKEGRIDVADGTESIMNGAFAGCSQVTEVALPSSVHEFSYMEFFSCPLLSCLYLMTEIPPLTAKYNGSTVFALRFASNDTKVFVPEAAYVRYQNTICNAPGVYVNMQGEQSESLDSSDLTGKKAIAKIKRERKK